MGQLRLLSAAAFAFAAAAPLHAEVPRQTDSDAYTRYELLGPDSHKFRIIYEITASTPGATAYYNPIRPGSIATNESVFDRATGKPVKFGVVKGDVAKEGGVRNAKPGDEYIKVDLARPVPADGGEGRVLIDKTYEDAKSYFASGDTITFDRPLGIKRNSIILPLGYELVSSNYPAQILQEADGRIKISFWNNTPAEAPVKIVARKSPGFGTGPTSFKDKRPLDERAYQNREIVYFLNDPETHSFSLYHDYTETKPGTAIYINVVRTGSKASAPSAKNLDTGEPLKWEIVHGKDAILKFNPAEHGVEADSEAVVFHFAPVPKGGSTRLRFFETYTDPARYVVNGDELVWHRAFGRPSNAMVLPKGWVLTNSSVPATITTTEDGRTRLDFLNPRTDEVDTIVTARRRKG